jgi:hypothetical protein
MQAEEDYVVGERAARETGAGATRNERRAGGGKNAHDLDGLLSSSGKNRQAWLATISRQSIGVVDEQLRRTQKDKPLPNDACQVACQFFSHA